MATGADGRHGNRAVRNAEGGFKRDFADATVLNRTTEATVALATTPNEDSVTWQTAKVKIHFLQLFICIIMSAASMCVCVCVSVLFFSLFVCSAWGVGFVERLVVLCRVLWRGRDGQKATLRLSISCEWRKTLSRTRLSDPTMQRRRLPR